jgi:hypothetical protein
MATFTLTGGRSWPVNLSTNDSPQIEHLTKRPLYSGGASNCAWQCEHSTVGIVAVFSIAERGRILGTHNTLKVTGRAAVAVIALRRQRASRDGVTSRHLSRVTIDKLRDPLLEPQLVDTHNFGDRGPRDKFTQERI